jgi:hypothetical protein
MYRLIKMGSIKNCCLANADFADKYSTGTYLPTLVRQIKKFDLKKQPEKFYVLYLHKK